MRRLLVGIALFGLGCGPLTADKACAKLEGLGVSECKEAKLEGLAYVAVGKGYEFKLSGVEKPGRVLDFPDGEKLKVTKEALVGFSRLTGETVAVNESKLLIVELPKETPQAKADEIKAAVEGW